MLLRSHGGGNCSGDGGAHEGGPDLHPTEFNRPCILSNGEVIKYHKFISVVVIELSARCLNTGPEDRLTCA